MAIGALIIPVVIGALAIGAAGRSGSGGAEHASAALNDAAGSSVGTATFVQDGSGKVHVNVHVKGLAPGLHGIHVHNVASCAMGSTAFAGAGAHHNPAASTHGHHAGDLPNLTVNDASVGHLNTTTANLTLSEGPSSVFDSDGSALVIHLAQDDLVTDPTGNSGARIACGVIELD
jgi:Cu-Zn family superoxide dismutase